MKESLIASVSQWYETALMEFFRNSTTRDPVTMQFRKEKFHEELVMVQKQEISQFTRQLPGYNPQTVRFFILQNTNFTPDNFSVLWYDNEPYRLEPNINEDTLGVYWDVTCNPLV